MFYNSFFIICHLFVFYTITLANDVIYKKLYIASLKKNRLTSKNYVQNKAIFFAFSQKNKNNSTQKKRNYSYYNDIFLIIAIITI